MLFPQPDQNQKWKCLRRFFAKTDASDKPQKPLEIVFRFCHPVTLSDKQSQKIKGAFSALEFSRIELTCRQFCKMLKHLQQKESCRCGEKGDCDPLTPMGVLRPDEMEHGTNGAPQCQSGEWKYFPSRFSPDASGIEEPTDDPSERKAANGQRKQPFQLESFFGSSGEGGNVRFDGLFFLQKSEHRSQEPVPGRTRVFPDPIG